MPNPLIGKIFDEFPEESDWDVVVIGAGPNGLIAGAYLAKAGLKVATVERRYEIGGGLATEEILFPGYYSNMHSVYHMMVDYMPVLQDFNLDRHALMWTKPNAQAGMVFQDGKSLLLARMVEDSKDSITKFNYKDAIAFGKLMRRWRKIVDEILGPATYIPPMSPLDITMAMQKTRVGQEMLELVEQSPLEIITNNFEDDRVRALLLYTSCMWGLDPRETGIGMFVALMLQRGTNKCYCDGGSHKFAASLAREILGNGGKIVDAAEVTEILMEGGHVAGVRIAEGRTLRSKVVMSTLDPHTTFLDLVGAANLPPDLKDSVEGWKYDKWSYYTLHVATKEPPRYKCDDNWIDDAFMTVFGIEGLDQLLAHWDNVVAGKVDMNSFGGHATCESRFDPHLVHSPYGGYVSFFQMHAPYEIDGGWDEKGKELEEAVLAKWQKAAPNMTKDIIIRTDFESPVGIETRFPNMRRGGIKHGDYKPIQLGCFRPNQDCSSTATPVPGLYVCGASTYPGGMVLGGPGYLGANRVAEDLGVTKWWKPTRAMEHYIKTYLEEATIQ
jgi:phytoene dehydrogenase-like protein